VTILLSRRRLVAGLVGLVAAPAVVRAASLMPVKSFIWDLSTSEGEAAYRAMLSGQRGGDMIFSSFEVLSGHVCWPWKTIGFMRHRRDLADLDELYRSQVLTRRRRA
jgi:hypothetical protein